MEKVAKWMGPLVRGMVCMGLGAVAATGAHAQEWKPSKPVRLLVGFAPGGSADLLARLVQGPLSESLGVPVVVENVPGAGGNIAADKLAKAPADGYTIGMGAAGAMAVTHVLNAKGTPYKADDFTPIAMLATQPNVVIINPALPVKSMADFAAYVKKTPQVTYGTAGVGTSNHLIAETMLHRLGVDMVHAPYKGATPVITDLMGGHIAMTVDNITTAASLVKSGKVRAIAVTSSKRSPLLPEVPTLAESGLKDFNMPTWQGIFGPKDLPKPIVARYNQALVKALANPEVKKKMAEFGSEPVGDTPEHFASFLAQDRKMWADVIKAAKITLD
ncbi:MFS transporter [Cupriavidus sp. TA19]|uniref:Bug family tripartite tricarboxylate transporter substrate binding protein n=1 Tax=unclassified Cupriavidus TaxID=2640874 RepID=UPI00272941B7|nr:tripartite tricarboxylate transporter substrate binding protein [Cupriavidus sp. TA19]GLC92431.1 MFS transporter [Cupriavidus sp. TA19]